MKSSTIIAAGLAVASCVLFWASSTPAIAAPQTKPKPKVVDFKKEVAPVIKKYCTGCHTGEYAPEGVVFPANMTEDWAKKNAKIMKKSAAEMKGKKMPPKDTPQPTAAQSKAVQDWIAKNIK